MVTPARDNAATRLKMAIQRQAEQVFPEIAFPAFARCETVLYGGIKH
jgi:hypothetical protein